MITINPDSPVPPFEQVRTQLAGHIHSGDLMVGTRLPTIRQLAADLGLAANTVARAYRELEEAGLVETQGRSGTRVAATGQVLRQRAWQAAEHYAATVSGLGLGLDEARRVVLAALDDQAASRAPYPVPITSSAAGPTRPSPESPACGS